MSIKRLVPILLLLTLVTGIAACQPDSVEEAVEATAEKVVAQKEAAHDVDDEGHAEPDVDLAGHEDPDRDEAGLVEAEHEEASHEEAEHSGGEEHSASAEDHDNDSSAADHDAAEPVRADLPEFVVPEPTFFEISPEALAFAMGDPDAPVQIIEFSDYQCPFCARHAAETAPALIENLVESGRVFYGIKDLPLDGIHPQARTASVAARCAGEQDEYLAMRNAIFATQPVWNNAGEKTEAVFVGLAQSLDLDIDAFTTCTADDSQADNVQANLEEALSKGVSSTPVTFVDGYAIAGAQPYELFEMAVKLAEAGELDAAVEAQARLAYQAMLEQQVAQQMPAPPVEAAEVNVEDAYAIGDPDAPVTIIEYTDYQCSFCARHALQTFSQIEEELIDSGRVRYVFRDMPLTNIHPQATLAAEAARCAGAHDQEAFVAMHDLLFENQRAWSGNSSAADLFAGYAVEIGLDNADFTTCLENHEFEAAVQADTEEALSLGINGTPAFLINGEPVFGAQPYELFAQAVDTLIAEADVLPASS